MENDAEKIVEQASKETSVQELQRQGIKKVRVVTKGAITKFVQEAIDKVLSERKQELTRQEIDKVTTLVTTDIGKDASQLLSDKMDSMMEMVKGLVAAGRLPDTEIKTMESFRGNLSSLMSKIEIESNLEQVGTKKVEGDGVGGALERLKKLRGG